MQKTRQCGETLVSLDGVQVGRRIAVRSGTLLGIGDESWSSIEKDGKT